jgi:hypothetical protein
VQHPLGCSAFSSAEVSEHKAGWPGLWLNWPVSSVFTTTAIAKITSRQEDVKKLILVILLGFGF